MAEAPEEDAAEAAFKQHYHEVYRYLLRKTGSHVEADELTQSVFADAAAALGKSQPDSPLAWLYAVARRRFVDEVRRRRRLAAVPPAVTSFDDLFYNARLRHELIEAMRRLDPQQRRIVLMKLVKGQSFAEIALALETTEAACKMRFSRALRTLREDLTRRGIEP